MQKSIHLFRHGQTDWNVLRRMQGHTDIPLNEEGRKQALTLQEYFQENPVEFFVSSDLIRAQQTAEIAKACSKSPLIISPEFREVFLGELEGLTQTEAHEKFGLEMWEQWTSIKPEFSQFCYPQAESALDAVERFTLGLQRICTEYNFTSAGLCAHGLIIRRFLHTLRPDLLEPLPIPNCVVYKVEWNEATGLFTFSL
ncbi:MAG: histidine phosphatase family protein [Pseudobdellovibrionaceae bacterium]